MKKLYFLMMGLCLTGFAFGQNTQQQAEKQIMDPQRKVNAGKADALIAIRKDLFSTVRLLATIRRKLKITKQ